MKVLLMFLVVEPGFRMFLGYTMKNKWRHGSRSWMQFTAKVASFSANCGMSAVRLIKVINGYELTSSLW